MTNLKRGVFLFVKKGIIKDNILQFQFRKKGFYYYYKFKDCNRESCNFNNFEKIKIDRLVRRDYIKKYDIITFARNITPPLSPPLIGNIPDIQGYVELTSFEQKQNEESEKRRKDESEINNKKKKYYEDVKKQQVQILEHKNTNIISKDRILKNGINNELKVGDFILVIFNNNSYIILQCVNMDSNSYYFLKLFIINRMVQYKNDEMDKLHECNDDCINKLLSDSKVFNIYHDSTLFNNEVYAKIIGPNHTNNISSALNTKTSPIIVVSNSSVVLPASNNENLPLVLRNNTRSKSNNTKSNSVKRTITKYNNAKNKSKPNNFFPITHSNILEIYKNFKKLVKAKIMKKTGLYKFTKNNKNNKNKTKKSNGSKNNNTSNKLLEILDSVKKPSSSKNINDLKKEPIEIGRGDMLIFNIFDDIYYFMECNKVVSKGENDYEYKMRIYECNKKTKKCQVNENKNITLNEKQMKFIIVESVVIKLFKLKSDFKDIADEILLSSENSNDIKKLYDMLVK